MNFTERFVLASDIPNQKMTLEHRHRRLKETMRWMKCLPGFINELLIIHQIREKRSDPWP